MRPKQTTQTRAQMMADELRHEAANLEQEVKALLKAADVLDKAGQKDPIGSLVLAQKKQEELLGVKNVA